jgi:tRNA(Arg) A34 adenosine deaminase TadA
MCLGAIYWARLKKVYFACTQEDAAGIAFDDQHIYEELEKKPGERQIKFENLMRNEALPLFKQWKNNPDKTPY